VPNVSALRLVVGHFVRSRHVRSRYVRFAADYIGRRRRYLSRYVFVTDNSPMVTGWSTCCRRATGIIVRPNTRPCKENGILRMCLPLLRVSRTARLLSCPFEVNRSAWLRLT